jgi:hypothetical protein
LFQSLSFFTVFFSLLTGSATAALAVAILWARWRIFPNQPEGRIYDLAVHAHLAVVVLLSMMIAMVFAEAENDYTQARENVWREADLLHDVFRNLNFYGSQEAEEIGVALATYTNTLIDEEWDLLSRNQYSDTASDQFQDVYVRSLRLREANTTQNWLHGHILENLAVLSGLRHERFFTARDRLPAIFWIVIILGFLLVCGYFTVYSKTRTNMSAIASVGFFFGVVCYLIFAFEDAYDGHLSVSSQPLIVLYQDVMVPTIDARVNETGD